MPILGIVMVLEDPRPSTLRSVARELAAFPDVELGEPAEYRWPAVLEARDQQAAESRILELTGLPGITSVDVVYADFEDLLPPAVSFASPEAREES